MTTEVSKQSTHRLHFKAMGSACEIVLAAESYSDVQAIAQFAIDEVLRIERKYSRYTDDSIIAKINQQAGKSPIPCDDETWALFQFATQLFEKSDGLFDMTSGVLRQAWDFKNPTLPQPEKLQELISRMGWQKVQLQNQSIRFSQEGMEIDLGGFGKEYAADRAANVLKEKGVNHGYVNLAGDMRFIGPKPSGEPWMIGIQNPRQRNEVIATLPMSHGGLATSGDYEKYFESDGKRYCHVLNPKTGYPVNYWRTVSVSAPMTVLAGCTTTMTMLKEEQGLSFLESTGFDFLAIDSSGQFHTKK